MAIRILIVDDEPLILKGLRFSLEQDGYLVQEALDGETALALAQSNQYDIIPVSYTHLDVYKRQFPRHEK